jgi:hypothetical protein
MPTSWEDHPAVQALRRHGYTVQWQAEGADWVCTAVSVDETWVGRGADPHAALEACLTQLAPSKVARRLLDEAGASSSASRSGSDLPAARLESSVAPATSARDLRSLLDDLQTVSARVEAGIPEVALMAPALQKLHVLAWISRARAIEQEAGRQRAATEATGAIARRLTYLCKTWWPGSLRALQAAATPERAAREQGLPPATHWLEVAEAAEAKLEALMAEPPGDDGWKDSAALAPPPENPEHEIEFAIRTLERLIAPIDIPPVGQPQAIASRDELHLEDAAVRLRWTRAVAPDPERWGAAVGRLRWVAAHGRGGTRLPKLLDPNYVPRPNWAAEAQAARSRLLAADPPPDALPEFVTWLVAAFDAMDGPTLAGLLREARTLSGAPALPLALRVTESDLPRNDRRLRRRLRHLHDLLQGRPAEPVESTAEAGVPATSTLSEEPTLVRPTHDELIFSRVRAKVPGATALFVSNREDPPLHERLERALGWSIEWSTAEPRRIAAITVAIARGKYDVVLSATGFQDHSTDVALARAASASQTLYVRVNRGRIAACARALARELGIRREELSADPPAAERAAG